MDELSTAAVCEKPARLLTTKGIATLCVRHSRVANAGLLSPGRPTTGFDKFDVSDSLFC